MGKLVLNPFQWRGRPALYRHISTQWQQLRSLCSALPANPQILSSLGPLVNLLDFFNPIKSRSVVDNLKIIVREHPVGYRIRTPWKSKVVVWITAGNHCSVIPSLEQDQAGGQGSPMGVPPVTALHSAGRWIRESNSRRWTLTFWWTLLQRERTRRVG